MAKSKTPKTSKTTKPVEAAPLTFAVSQVPIDSIRPYEKNARVIPQSGVDLVAKSIQQFGFRQPIVVDKEGVIIAGHTRHLAAKQLGMSSVLVHVMDGTPEKIKAYRLMDNRSNQESTWDTDILREELGDLAKLFKDDTSAVADMTGFGNDELNALIGSLGKAPDLNPKGSPAKTEEGGESASADDPDDGEKCSCPRCGFKFRPQQQTRIVKKARKLFGEVAD